MADDLPLHWILHELDEEAVRHEAELAKLPEQRRAYDTRVATEKRRVDASAAAQADRQKRRTAFERDIAAFEEQESRYTKQLDAVTNQQQFEAKQHEIAGVQAKRSELETQVLTLMDEEEALAGAHPALAAALAKAEQESAAAHEKFAATEASLREKLASLDARRTETVAKLDAPSRTRYERMHSGRAGRAVASIDNGACGTCFHGLSPSSASDARRREKLVVCEGCGRLLMFPPEGTASA